MVEEGVWTDVFDLPLSYKYWKAGAPNNWSKNEHCAEMNNVGEWNDKPCDVKEANCYVCQYSYMNHSTPKTPKTPETPEMPKTEETLETTTATTTVPTQNWKWGPPKTSARCGAEFSADCPSDKGPCCSKAGYCGITDDHCCNVCVDFRTCPY